jgi:periplasmic protein TonB
MEIKKSPKVDLEKKRGLFLQAGFLIAIIVIIVVFRWSNTSATVVTENKMEDNDSVTKSAFSSLDEKKSSSSRKVVQKSLRTSESDKHSDETQIEKIGEVAESGLEQNQAGLSANPSVAELVPAEDQSNVLKEEQIDDQEKDVPVFYLVEEMPEFPGGDEALKSYLAGVHYPASALDNEIQGRVYISFVINAKGLVEDVKVARGVDTSLDRAALEQVKKMPPWRPGKQQGRPVKVSYTVPINFVLEKH